MEISPSTGNHQTCLQEGGREPEKSATPGLRRATKIKKMGSDEVHKGGGGRGGSERNGEDEPRSPNRATIGHDLMDTRLQMRERRLYRDGGVGAASREGGIKGGGGWGEKGG